MIEEKLAELLNKELALGLDQTERFRELAKKVLVLVDYENLKKSQEILNVLYAAGVDSWEGYEL